MRGWGVWEKNYYKPKQKKKEKGKGKEGKGKKGKGKEWKKGKEKRRKRGKRKKEGKRWFLAHTGKWAKPFWGKKSYFFYATRGVTLRKKMIGKWGGAKNGSQN